MSLPPSASEDIKPRLPLSPAMAGPSHSTAYVLLEGSQPFSQLSDDPDLHLLQSVEDIPNFRLAPDVHDYRAYPDPSSSYGGSSYAESSFAESSVLSGDTPGLNTYPHHPQGNFVQGANTMHQTINTLFSEHLLQQFYYDVIDRQPAVYPSVSMPNLPRRDGTVPWDMQPFMADVPGQYDETFYADALMGISTLMDDPPSQPPIPAPAPHVPFPYPSEYQQYSKCASRILLRSPLTPPYQYTFSTICSSRKCLFFTLLRSQWRVNLMSSSLRCKLVAHCTHGHRPQSNSLTIPWRLPVTNW